MSPNALRAIWRGPFVRTGLLIASIAAWPTIAVLSLVPGEDRPNTGMPGRIEHALAYAIAAFVTRLAFRRIASRWQALAFSVAAGLFEIGQIWVPGRNATVGDWAASTAGAVVGVIVARAIAHLLEPRRG